ncbi:MAG: hypothetical protein AVDCRST_MAG67-4232 [uncultured Solirubrobacteraceae bacterium]|uniref:Uncharacterized protein n=1 Tax=uncultured Solirubrobacteraceae bacterium TaxID=1162706 RepID=A0A6J4TNF6_9ACTN|nr:MAG: hypothetical protein AVDCRST_MAG67-4232 [uncultured Solirubrobacteraceae bacterium]
MRAALQEREDRQQDEDAQQHERDDVHDAERAAGSLLTRLSCPAI